MGELRSGKETWTKLSEAEVAYHTGQYKQPYRSTVHSIEHLRRHAGLGGEGVRRVLDIGSGGGANIHWLAREFPGAEFTGIDLSLELVELAESCNRDLGNVHFQAMDFRDAPSALGEFDLALSFQVLSWLSFEDAAALLRTKFSMARKAVFLTSLFSRDDLDFEIKINDYSVGKVLYYNVYSIERIRILAEEHGFALSRADEFQIDVDLPRVKGRGTYTVMTGDGRRLQFSSCLYLPWHFLLFEKICPPKA